MREGVAPYMPFGAERQINWITDLMQHLEQSQRTAAEPTPESEQAWGEELSAIANATLFPRTDWGHLVYVLPATLVQLCLIARLPEALGA